MQMINFLGSCLLAVSNTTSKTNQIDTGGDRFMFWIKLRGEMFSSCQVR